MDCYFRSSPTDSTEQGAVSDIANELCLSVKTISTYRTRVMSKMCMKKNAELTLYSVHNKLIN